MGDKKYVFTDNKKIFDGVTYIQIRAARDFEAQNNHGKSYVVRSGELGGWIETGCPGVLDQSGPCWVHPYVYVRCNSSISDAAVVMGASEDARVFISGSQIRDNVFVINNSIIGSIYIKCSLITGNSSITTHFDGKMVITDSKIHSSFVTSSSVDYSKIQNSEISNSKVEGMDMLEPIYFKDALLHVADIRKTREYTEIKNLGRSNHTLYCYPGDNRRPVIMTGCFRGTFTQFENQVNFTYDPERWNDSCGFTQEEFGQLKEEYLMALDFLRVKYKNML